MRESNLGKIQSPLQADLDRVTDRIVEALDVDYALLSIKHNRHLVSMGLSETFGRTRDRRWHVPEDLVCFEMLKKGRPLVLVDAREHVEFGATKHVMNGTVAGYIGVPIQNAEIGTIGTLCGITSKPRDWAESDLGYLVTVGQNVENMILREMYRLESKDASRLVSEYDQIIAAFSLVRAEPTSIHDPNGRLVFANRALTEHVSDAELQNARIKKALMAKDFATSTKVHVADGRVFSVTRGQTSSGYYVFQWARVASRLN